MSIQTRIEEAQSSVKRRMFEDCPWLLPDKVAQHYASLGVLSLTLHKLVECNQYGGETVSTREMELYILRQIFDKHVTDFGTPPAWANVLHAYEEFLAQKDFV